MYILFNLTALHKSADWHTLHDTRLSDFQLSHSNNKHTAPLANDKWDRMPSRTAGRAATAAHSKMTDSVQIDLMCTIITTTTTTIIIVIFVIFYCHYYYYYFDTLILL